MKTGLSDADELRLLRLFLASDSCTVDRANRSMVRAEWYATMRMGEGLTAITSPGEGPTRARAMVLAALRYEAFMARQASK
jgi:hypothetical protein